MTTKDELQKELEEMYLEKAHTCEAIEYWEDRLVRCNARIVYLTTQLTTGAAFRRTKEMTSVHVQRRKLEEAGH